MPTNFGLHVAQGARDGYGPVVAAAPAVVIAVGEGGALVEANQKSGGRTVTIYREQTVFHDAPQNIDHMSVAEARQAADHFWPALKAAYDQNPADYYQVTNETGGDNRKALANIFAFETRLMELAERDGYKLAVASPAGGSPGSWDLWVELFVPHIRRAGQGGHIYSRHAYGGVATDGHGGFLTVPGPRPADDNAGRPFREAAYLRGQGIHTPMVITEAGQNGGYRFPGVDAFMEDMIRYDQLCLEHDNIWGFCSWTYGNYQNRPANIQAASGRMKQYLQSAGGAVRSTYPAATAPPAETPTGASRAEAAGFRADVDLDDVPAGASFTATWTFRNSGDTTWDHRYRLAYTDQPHPETAGYPRSPFGDATGYSFRELGAPAQVAPGETVSLTVPMRAPDSDATHATNWQLQTPAGRPFGPIRWMRAVVHAGQADPPERIEGGSRRPPATLAFGVHDEAGAEWMRSQGIRGWGLHTVALGPNAARLDLSRFAGAGIRMLVRLNYGYHPQGNVPLPGMADYDRFIDAAARTIADSRGVWGWIIGNETNNALEWPGGPEGTPITAAAYATLYNRIYGRRPAGARIGPQAVDPYNALSGDSRVYWQQILDQIDGAHFLTLHPKTQDSNPDNVDSAQEFSHAPLLGQFYHLRAYQPLMERVPDRFRHLPVIATEVNPQRHNDGATLGWQEDQGAAWVRRAAAHFDNYNRQAAQPVVGVIFYRFDHDDWKLRSKPSILDAIKQVARS